MADLDITALLTEPVIVQTAHGKRKMSPFEASLRGLVQRAIVKRDINAIMLLFEQFEAHGILTETPPAQSGGVIVMPRGPVAELLARIVAERKKRKSADNQEIISEDHTR